MSRPVHGDLVFSWGAEPYAYRSGPSPEDEPMYPFDDLIDSGAHDAPEEVDDDYVPLDLTPDAQAVDDLARLDAGLPL